MVSVAEVFTTLNAAITKKFPRRSAQPTFASGEGALRYTGVTKLNDKPS
jgi:hypothetical protein